MSTALRSLGSPENIYRAIATSAAGEFSTVTKLEVIDAGPGFADVVATAAEGFPRSSDHCAWTSGLLTCGPVLFGLDAATVEHEECQAVGATQCVYHIRWDTQAESVEGSPEQITALEHQLDAMKERLHSVFAAASDLIAADDLDESWLGSPRERRSRCGRSATCSRCRSGPAASSIATTGGSRRRRRRRIRRSAPASDALD